MSNSSRVPADAPQQRRHDAHWQRQATSASDFGALVQSRAALNRAAANQHQGQGMQSLQSPFAQVRGRRVVRVAARAAGKTVTTEDIEYADYLDAQYDRQQRGGGGGGGGGEGGGGSDGGGGDGSGSGSGSAGAGAGSGASTSAGAGSGSGGSGANAQDDSAPHHYGEAHEEAGQGQHQGAVGAVAEQLQHMRDMAARNQYMNLVYLQMQSKALDNQRLTEVTANMITIKHEVYLMIIKAWVSPFGTR